MCFYFYKLIILIGFVMLKETSLITMYMCYVFSDVPFFSDQGMVQKYVSVLQRYFVQYLAGFDVTLLKEVVQVCEISTMFVTICTLLVFLT